MKLNKIYLRQIVFWLFVLFLANFVQMNYYEKNIKYIAAIRFKIYFGAYFLIFTWTLREIYLSIFSKKGAIYPILESFRNSKIPLFGKTAILIIVLGNCFSIFVGKPSYPFYDVGMFRWSEPFKDKHKILYKPKYYYFENGKPKIFDLRKEGFYFLHEKLGITYTHEFTFAANYHNKGQKENFDFLLNQLKPLGIDTLWVGVHVVNYETKEVWFDFDICNAIKINKEEPIHYGPIYIPTYQMKKCNEN